MLLIYKNKGILIPVYFFASGVGVAILFRLSVEVLGVEPNFPGAYALAIACFITAFWTYVTRDSYYVSNGQRKPMNEENSFFFISMKIWAYIFICAGVFAIVGQASGLFG